MIRNTEIATGSTAFFFLAPRQRSGERIEERGFHSFES
jgi:hypothetical protein